MFTVILLTIALNTYADTVMRVNADGSTSLHNRYYKNGKEVISPFKNQEATARWMANQNRFVGSSTVNVPVVSGRTGAVSAGTVQATVTQGVSKRVVMGEILDKARTGGKALGRFAVGNSPYGRAFNLALGALALSDFFWSDEKGDFLREKDDNTYVVFTVKNGSAVPSNKTVDETSFKEMCANYDGGCEVLSYVKGSQAANQAAIAYCQSQSYKGSNGSTQNFTGVGWAGYCASVSVLGSSSSYRAVKVWKYIDYVPMTLDEFIDEAEPEADAEPSDWVNTSEVKPDEEDVTVKGGTVAQTNPYTDPKDGKVKQTKWEFEDKDGDGDADGVRETTLERPDIPPNSPEAPELKPPTDTDTGTGDDTGDKKEPEPNSASQPPFDLCKEHPEILACQLMGEAEPNVFDDIEIPHVTDDTTWEEDRFLPSNGTCPQPKTFHVFGKPVQLSYEPLCRFMEQVRFIILAAFILMSAYLTFGSLRRD